MGREENSSLPQRCLRSSSTSSCPQRSISRKKTNERQCRQDESRGSRRTWPHCSRKESENHRRFSARESSSPACRALQARQVKRRATLSTRLSRWDGNRSAQHSSCAVCPRNRAGRFPSSDCPEHVAQQTGEEKHDFRWVRSFSPSIKSRVKLFDQHLFEQRESGKHSIDQEREIDSFISFLIAEATCFASSHICREREEDHFFFSSFTTRTSRCDRRRSVFPPVPSSLFVGIPTLNDTERDERLIVD